MVRSAPPSPPRLPWPPAVRGLASLLILGYLAAVIVPPLAGPPPASDLARVALEPLRPLVGALSLGHGYRFFAPNPGPGHSIAWSMLLPDGRSRTGVLPDPVGDRPRLLYHRRFMISEKIAALVPPADAPDEVRRQAKQDWQPLVKDVAGQLLRRHGGSEVTLTLIEHYLPAPDESLRSEQGTDIVVPLGTYGFSGGDMP
jgi:hypothetical protein